MTASQNNNLRVNNSDNNNNQYINDFNETTELTDTIDDDNGSNIGSDSESDTESQDSQEIDQSYIDTIDTSKYSLILCEFYNSNLHGNSSLNNHYLVLFAFTGFNNELRRQIRYFKQNNLEIAHQIRSRNFRSRHPLIKNYYNIICSQQYSQPQIAQCVYLPGGECVAILKTFYIRIIQRAWKKVFTQRKRIFRLRRHPQSIYQYQITGSWPLSCALLPSLRGLLTSHCS
jgi:hypothetical protein